MKIQITTEDFRNATCYTDTCSCPLAVAVKRHFPQSTHVSCCLGRVDIKDMQSEYSYRVTWDWCSDQKLYGGEYEGMRIDDMISLAKSNPNIEFPTIELELELEW
jgi:hypothetical protein